MIRFFSYMKYLFWHRWYVFLECAKRGLFWRGLVHDLSKFRPSEFWPYMRFYYNQRVGKARTREDCEAFDRAWLCHIHKNAHHWQHHLLHEDEGKMKVMPMPYKYRVEMVCDWIGAGRAQGYGNDVLPWYRKHRNKMKLHETTRRLVEQELGN